MKLIIRLAQKNYKIANSKHKLNKQIFVSIVYQLTKYNKKYLKTNRSA